MSRYALTPLIVALSPSHSDKTRFRPWSPIATGNYLDRVEKNSKFAQTIGDDDVFYPRSGISGPTSGEFQHVQTFMKGGPNPLT